jgi:hypothetical protein
MGYAMAKEFALDIFHLLGQIDKNQTQFFSSLSDEQKKGYAPLIAMRWMAGTTDNRQILYLNELVNPFVFTIGDHKELLYKLQCAASSKIPRRYTWMTAKSTSGAKKDKALDVIMQYHNYGVREAKSVRRLVSNDDIIAMAEELGFQKDELAKLKKDIK